MKLSNLAFLLGATLLAACEGDLGPEGPPGPPGGVDPTLSAKDKVISTFGGTEALSALSALSAQVTGERAVLDEGYLPEDGAAPAARFEATLQWDLAQGHARLDYKRNVAFPFPSMYTYSEILRADGGWRVGIDNFFQAPAGALSSERWGSARRQQRLLHPELLVRNLATGKITAKELGLGVLDGVSHHRLEVADSVAPLTLWVAVGTGRLTKVSTIENEHLRADVPVEVHYADYQSLSGGVIAPRRAAITVDHEVVHEEERTITANPTIPASAFAIPGGGAPTLVADEVKRGERSHQFHEMFSGIGIPLDGGQTFVAPTQLRPGVWHVGGGSHNSLVVEQPGGIIVVEAPLYAKRSEALLTWIGTQFPGKSVTHVIATHFHGDHSGGLRTFVAAGATVVAGEAALGLYRKVFSARRTIEPDRQATAPRVPVIRGVAPGQTLTLDAVIRPVRIYTVATSHAADMLVAVVDGVLFVSDIYSPGIPGNPAALRELRAAITANPTIPVATIAGGHGGTSTLQQLDDLIAAAR